MAVDRTSREARQKPSPGKPADYVVVGAGLAGCLVAYEFERRGAGVLLVDDGGPGAASRVAAGLINPVTGKRLVPSRHFRAFWEVAAEAYDAIGGAMGREFLRRCDHIRVLRPPEEPFLSRRLEEEDFRSLVVRRDGPGALGEPVRDPRGSVRFGPGGTVAVPELCRALRDARSHRGGLVQRTVTDADIDGTASGIRFDGKAVAGIVLANGFRANRLGVTRGLPLRPVKGEILEGRFADGWVPDGVLNGGVWISPLSDGCACVGATYDFDLDDLAPAATARERLLTGLHGFVDRAFAVHHQRVGIRPASPDRMPLVGEWSPGIWVLNGLGSKGSLYAPGCARSLVVAILGELDSGPADGLFPCRRFN